MNSIFIAIEGLLTVIFFWTLSLIIIKKKKIAQFIPFGLIVLDLSVLIMLTIFDTETIGLYQIVDGLFIFFIFLIGVNIFKKNKEGIK